MRKIIIISISIIVAIGIFIKFLNSKTYTSKEIFDKKSGMTLNWEIIDKKNLKIKLKAETKGWVSIGFNASYAMKGANYILGYVDNNGKVHMNDGFGTDAIKHDSDVNLGGKNDVIDYSGKEENDITEIEFTIPLNSGDEYDKVIKPGKKVKVILAYGSTDDFTSKHIKHSNTINVIFN